MYGTILNSGLDIEWSHPLNRGTAFWMLGLPNARGGATWRNLLGRNHFTGVNTEASDYLTASGRPGGWGCLDLGGTNEYLSSTVVPAVYPLTVAGWFKVPNVTAGYNLFGLAKTSDSANYATIYIGGDVGGDPVQCVVQSTGAERIATSAIAYTANTWWHAIAVFESATSRAIYLNGRNKGTNTTSDTPTGLNQTNIGGLNNRDGPFGALLGQIDDLRIWTRAFNDNEAEQLYQLSKRGYPGILNRMRSVAYLLPASGSVTVTPGTATLTTTTFAPTVSTPRLCTPGTAALTISAFAPTVSTPRLCTPGTAALTISAFAPTVSTPRLVTPTTLTVTTTGYAPTVTVSSSGSVTVTPSTAALTLTSYAAVVSATWTIVRVLVVPAPIRSATLVAARRTVVVPAIAMPTLTRGHAMYRITDMHPADVRDLTWTLTPLLGSGETVSTAAIVIDGNVTAGAPTLAGAVVTARITASGAALGEQAVVTCRFTTSLSRQLDVSYYFAISARSVLLDQKDPSDTDRVTFNWSRLVDAGGEALSAATAVVDAGAITISSTSFAGENSQATIAAGTLGALAELRGQVTLDDGQIENFTAAIPIGQN